MQILLYIIFIRTFFLFDSSFYNISFESLEGNTISMSSFKGQRVLVFITDGTNPDIRHLSITDSIIKADQVITKVIIIPAIDLSADKNVFSSNKLITLFSALEKKGVIVSKPGKVKKESKTDQHVLLQWLTDLSANGHFNRDVEKDGQVFMISENGVLYGIHEKQLPASAIRKAMTRKIKE
ncbi:hypothetical protein [Agriterribacter sp.]|uniref:hypothetical protein n=1 Tax=Agriterribacter sp. TaxID=2821509 RepID=UPI002B940CE1|nr:hypothetical protein [Agriterribacter sp.]HTN08697.1 hypothetical protein [Agriterribacter sp.]